MVNKEDISRLVIYTIKIVTRKKFNKKSIRNVLTENEILKFIRFFFPVVCLCLCVAYQGFKRFFTTYRYGSSNQENNRLGFFRAIKSNPSNSLSPTS